MRAILFVFMLLCMVPFPVASQAPVAPHGPPGIDKPGSTDRGDDNVDVNAFLHSTILASYCPEKSDPGSTSPVVFISEAEQQKTLASRASMLNASSPVQQLLLAWLAWAKHWRHIYYGLTFATLIFGGLATALSDGNVWWKKYKTAAALCVTISGGASSALLPFNQFKKFDNAFSVINTAKLNYLTNINFSMCELGKAVGYGEAIIHQNN